MPVSHKQPAGRLHGLEPKDLPAILGIDPRRTPYDVWLEKTRRVASRPVLAPAVKASLRVEDAALQFARERLGRIRRRQCRAHPDLPLRACLDAVLVETGEPIQTQIAGLFAPAGGPWGDEGTDCVPDAVVVQAHAELLCLAPKTPPTAHVAAFVAGRGFLLYRIPRKETLCRTIAEEVERFWRCVRDDREPEGRPSFQVARMMRREPGKIVEIPVEVVTGWLAAREIERRAARALEAVEAGLLAALGDAEAGIASGLGMITYYSYTRRSLDQKRLREERPDVTAAYAAEITYRQLRYRKDQNTADGGQGADRERPTDERAADNSECRPRIADSVTA